MNIRVSLCSIGIVAVLLFGGCDRRLVEEEDDVDDIPVQPVQADAAPAEVRVAEIEIAEDPERLEQLFQAVIEPTLEEPLASEEPLPSSAPGEVTPAAAERDDG